MEIKYRDYNGEYQAITNLAKQNPAAAAQMAQELGYSMGPSMDPTSRAAVMRIHNANQTQSRAQDLHVGEVAGQTQKLKKNENELYAAYKKPLEDATDEQQEAHLRSQTTAALDGDFGTRARKDALNLIGRTATEAFYGNDGWGKAAERTPRLDKVGNYISNAAARANRNPLDYINYVDDAEMQMFGEGSRSRPFRGLAYNVGMIEGKKVPGGMSSNALDYAVLDAVADLSKAQDGGINPEAYATTVEFGNKPEVVGKIADAYGLSTREYMDALDASDNPQEAWVNHYKEVQNNLGYFINQK